MFAEIRSLFKPTEPEHGHAHVDGIVHTHEHGVVSGKIRSAKTHSANTGPILTRQSAKSVR